MIGRTPLNRLCGQRRFAIYLLRLAEVFRHNDVKMSLLIFSSVLAVLFFWAVGAYNRLVVLRASVAKQFAAVDAQLLRVLVMH